ncbi:hypothetical protein [Flavobacterium sp. NKUCC04_CG]|uniref:hypothetical protein n=1 Tax=Flavobacterium sp. NKUCC04_CG TaxID=2842121 RepID=UPI001C5B1684|nr:hypothetical protein [Flavobacterium sp. NKUCC04_CG]MBW3519496.1 hypothetical protein [Flavobacterium sp. NKUCC04_CG]
MLKINKLREFVAVCVATLEPVRSGKLVVTKDEVTKFMKDHEMDDNILLLAIVPEHDLGGQDDALKYQNMLGFYLFEKTDYSEHDHDSYLDIFVRTQAAAKLLVEKILEERENQCGFLGGMFLDLNTSSITISPVK